jgi:hypothetical protein
MAGLVPAIPMKEVRSQGNRDARDKPAHDNTKQLIAARVSATIWLRMRNIIIQIAPSIIFFGNEPRFVDSRPMLDVFLTLDRLVGRFIDFEMDKAVNSISPRVTVDHFLFVLINAAYEIISDADI